MTKRDAPEHLERLEGAGFGRYKLARLIPNCQISVNQKHGQGAGAGLRPSNANFEYDPVLEATPQLMLNSLEFQRKRVFFLK